MDEKEEQAKVREKILRVFKARAQSPGGGPAIIVHDEGDQTRKKCPESHIMRSTEFPKYKLPDSDDDFLISDTNVSPANDIPLIQNSRRMNQQPKEESKKQGLQGKQNDRGKSHKHDRSTAHQRSRQREKRRKSRSERNKEKAQKQQQMNPHEREEFRKHVKKAREITKHSRHTDGVQSDDQLFVAITQNRLTRQSGIYNQGKKSSRLYRDPLRVSKRVTAAVEEEVKMIVDPSDSPNLHSISMESSPPPPVVPTTPVVPDRRTRSSSRSCKSLTRKRESESEPVQRYRSKSGGCQSSSELSTQVLEMQDLSIQLAKSLDIKQLFPEKNYAGEIKCELQKLMKSNSAGKEETVTAESVKKYMTCLPHQENEVKSSRPVITKPMSTKTKSKTTAVAVSHSLCIQADNALHHATACVQASSCATSPLRGTPHNSQVLLLEVPEAATANNHVTSINMDHSSRASMTDNALEFLHFAETMAAECAQQQRSKHHDESVRLAYHGVPQSLEVREIESNFYHMDRDASSTSHGIDNRTSNNVFGNAKAKNRSMFTSDRCKVEWQPDAYHDTMMSLRQRYVDDDRARHSTLHSEPSSTDMLDHIGIDDMEVAGPSPFLPDPYYEHKHQRTVDHRLTQRRHQSTSANYHKPHTISQFEKCESDSESSPVWRPKFSVSPIKKPQLESPSAPELYPQKMF